MHQGLCNLPILSLIKAINAGFLQGAPHLTAATVQKYLMPSPATSKPHKGIRSKPPKPSQPAITSPNLPYPMPAAPGIPNNDDDSSGPCPAIIDNIDNKSIANVFCFGAFDKNTRDGYNDCTGNLPFMSLDGNICFFVMYHYEMNAIFATPIPGLDSKGILVAFKKNFEYLVSKGYKPKINIMDKQATKAIKFYLTPQECKLQLVEPGNHCVNTAKRAIQTFKNRFIGALGTTDMDFLIQLWDKKPPQVQDAINLVRRSRINPSKSAYEALKGLTIEIGTPWRP
jgi:hypothetical protein